MTRIASRQYRSTHRRLSQAPWLLFAALAPLWPAEAAAQSSCAELSCPVGYTCELAPTACPAIYCVGPDCPTCEAQPFAYCAAAPCSTNADCGEGMLCAEQVTTVCEDSAAAAPAAPAPAEPAPTTTDSCAPDSRCGATAPAPNCTSQTTFWCTPRWQLPCDVDADCGAGFRCEEQVACSTPPAYPSDPGDGVKADPPPRETVPVTCAPTGVSSCVVIQRTCTTDADCGAGWSCAAISDASCRLPSDGSSGCEPQTPVKQCQPPYSGLPAGGGTSAIATDSIGDVASAPGNAPAPTPRAVALGESDTSAPAVEGGCSLGTQRNTGSGLALFTLGLGAVFSALRRRAR